MPPMLRTSSLGLTLLELLVVITILALLAVATPSLFSSQAGHADVVRSLTAALREARAHAVFKNTEADLIVDLRARQYGLNHADTDLPPGTELRLTTAQELGTRNQTSIVRFFPDGSASGGQVEITTGAQSDLIEIGWLTGRIHLVN